MKFYGMENIGKIKAQVIPTLTVHTSSDIGRLVYVSDVEKLYIGTSTEWQGFLDVVDDLSPQLGADLDLNGFGITLVPVIADDLGSSGTKAPLTSGETLVIGNIVYIKSDGKAWKTNSTDDTKVPCIAISLQAGNANDSKSFLFYGFMRNDNWNWTAGGILYVDTTDGIITQIPPSVSGNQIQTIGVATHADRILFNPNYLLLEVS